MRGRRPLALPDAKWLGGHPPGWPYSGCNPSRFRPYPRWPPDPAVHDAIRGAVEHFAGSERFIYFGHGPTASQLAPKINAASQRLAAQGGVARLTANGFGQELRDALAPDFPFRAPTHSILFALRRAEERVADKRNASAARRQGSRRHLPAIQRKLLLDYVHARLSIEAFAAELTTHLGGLRSEFASRDRTYWYRWV